MLGVANLIPARFLCIIAHLVITITIIWSRDANIRACLPQTFTDANYKSKDDGLLAGLILMLIFIAIELAGFMAGVTMFVNLESLFSTAAHVSASVTLSFFVFETWPCDQFWYIFSACSAFPFTVDCGVLISKIWFRRSS